MPSKVVGHGHGHSHNESILSLHFLGTFWAGGCYSSLHRLRFLTDQLAFHVAHCKASSSADCLSSGKTSRFSQITSQAILTWAALSGNSGGWKRSDYYQLNVWIPQTVWKICYDPYLSWKSRAAGWDPSHSSSRTAVLWYHQDHYPDR